MNEAQESLLARIAIGEIPVDAQEVRAACRDAAFRAELERQEALLGALDEESVLREADALASAPGEERVADWVFEAAGAKRRPRIPYWASGLAAAAAVLLLFFVLRENEQDAELRRGTPDADPLGPALSAGALRCVHPLRSSDGLQRFAWEGGHEGMTYEVEVYWGDGQTDRSGRLEAREWFPPDDVRGNWKLPIEWAVHSYVASRLVDSAFAEVSSP